MPTGPTALARPLELYAVVKATAPCGALSARRGCDIDKKHIGVTTHMAAVNPAGISGKSIEYYFQMPLAFRSRACFMTRARVRSIRAADRIFWAAYRYRRFVVALSSLFQASGSSTIFQLNVIFLFISCMPHSAPVLVKGGPCLCKFNDYPRRVSRR